LLILRHVRVEILGEDRAKECLSPADRSP
jgi:hypothetical protein